MRSLPPVLLASALLLGSVALIARERPSDPYSRAHLRALLSAPLTKREKDAGPQEPLWRALLAHPRVRRSEQGLELPLGRLQTDPSIARASAEAAGELLTLASRDPDGRDGPPLFEVLLASSAAREENGQRIVKLYGCRHSATPDGAPALEDSYYARLALAEGLERAAAEAGRPILIEGRDAPVVGGANFEVAWIDGRQVLDVTFAQEPTRRWNVSRPFEARAPHDGRARAALVAELQALAASDPALGPLTILGIEEARLDGIDLRLELFGGRLSVSTSTSQGPRLSSFVVLERRAEDSPQKPPQDS